MAYLGPTSPITDAELQRLACGSYGAELLEPQTEPHFVDVRDHLSTRQWAAPTRGLLLPALIAIVAVGTAIASCILMFLH